LRFSQIDRATGFPLPPIAPSCLLLLPITPSGQCNALKSSSAGQ
jgi:hypothetical protein